MKVYAQQDDNLDAIIYRYFGRSNGLLEETMSLNPHLSVSAILDIGTEVLLPEEINTNAIKADTLQLWT
ncbi:tail protein X [Pasteurella bettyae]